MASLAKERAMPDNRTGNPEIGARLRRLRLMKELTQAELGEKLEPKVDQTTISTYETGTVDVSTATMEQLIKLLDTTATFLFGETDHPLSPEEDMRRLGLDPGNAKDLEERDRRLVAEIARRLRATPLPGQGEPHDGPEDTATVSAG